MTWPSVDSAGRLASSSGCVSAWLDPSAGGYGSLMTGILGAAEWLDLAARIKALLLDRLVDWKTSVVLFQGSKSP